MIFINLCMTEVGPPLCDLCRTNPILMDRTLVVNISALPHRVEKNDLVNPVE